MREQRQVPLMQRCEEGVLRQILGQELVERLQVEQRIEREFQRGEEWPL